jgi:hypothetical protein
MSPPWQSKAAGNKIRIKEDRAKNAETFLIYFSFLWNSLFLPIILYDFNIKKFPVKNKKTGDSMIHHDIFILTRIFFYDIHYKKDYKEGNP